MQKADPIDANKLEFGIYSPLEDFSNLNFTNRDGSDPLDVDAFIHGNPQDYVENNISAIYTVRYEHNLVGFFTLSMSNIGKGKLQSDGLFSIPYSDYPALLLGQLGVERNYQGRGIGQNICKFCRGIGQDLNERAACAFLILRTTVELAKRYYEPKCKFKWKPKQEGKTWMYYRLFTTKKRYLIENISITESVTAKVTKAVDVERMKDNPLLCSICREEKEIVLRDGNFKLCKVCQDKLKEKYGY